MTDVKRMTEDPVVEVTMRIRLREYHGDESRPLPDDLTTTAVLDTARRLAVHAEGALVVTTLFREPGDVDSDCVEDVGGGWKIVSVVPVEDSLVTKVVDAHAALTRAGVPVAGHGRPLPLPERIDRLATAYLVRKEMHEELLRVGEKVADKVLDGVADDQLSREFVGKIVVGTSDRLRLGGGSAVSIGPLRGRCVAVVGERALVRDEAGHHHFTSLTRIKIE